MYDQNAFQASIEMWFAAFCLIATACLMVGRDDQTKTRKALMLLQLNNAIYMAGEGTAYFLIGGGENGINYWGTRIANFCAYAGEFAMLIATTFYIRAKIIDGMEEKGEVKKMYWHLPMTALGLIALGMLIVNQIYPLFYYFDESNIYHRADYYLVSQAIGLIMIIYPLVALFIYRKHVSRFTGMAITIFAIAPLIAMAYQYFHYGLSFTGFATTGAVLLLFVTYELDYSRKMELQNKKKFETLVYKQ